MRRGDAAAPECPFCAIIAGRGPADIVREWNHVISIVPLGPAVEGHALIIPHHHFSRPEHYPGLSEQALGCALEYAACRGEDYHLIINVGTDAGQTVPHLHWHYLPRTAGDGVRMPWSTGQARAAAMAHFRCEDESMEAPDEQPGQVPQTTGRSPGHPVGGD